MKKVLITGGAGFIGCNVSKYLLKKGFKVKVIDDLSTGKKGNLAEILEEIEFVEGSILDLKLLQKAMSDVDFIVHLAAIPSVPRSIKEPFLTSNTNILGTLNVFELAKNNNLKVIYASSSSVYGDSLTLPKKEDMIKNPLSFYAIQKSSNEDYAKVYNKLFNTNFIGLRFFNVFGPNQDPNSEYSAVIPKFIRLIKEKKEITIFGDGKTSRDFTFVDNVSEMIYLCLTKENNYDLYNVACAEKYDLNFLANTLMNILNSKVSIKYEDERKGDIKHSLADISRARELGYTPKILFEEGLKKTVNHYG